MWNLPLRLLPLQDEVEASVGRGPGVPGRGQQDVPALALPVPSGPAYSGPLPVPEPSPGSAPAAASHPQPRCRPAAPLTVCNQQQQQQKKTTNKYLKEYERLFGGDELLGFEAAAGQEVTLSSVWCKDSQSGCKAEVEFVAPDWTEYFQEAKQEQQEQQTGLLTLFYLHFFPSLK